MPKSTTRSGHRPGGSYTNREGSPGTTRSRRTPGPPLCLFISHVGRRSKPHLLHGRLGLWGPQTSFPNGFEEFMSEIDAGGLGALELVTRSMKAFGMSRAS